ASGRELEYPRPADDAGEGELVFRGPVRELHVLGQRPGRAASLRHPGQGAPAGEEEGEARMEQHRELAGARDGREAGVAHADRLRRPTARATVELLRPSLERGAEDDPSIRSEAGAGDGAPAEAHLLDPWLRRRPPEGP